MSDPLSIGYLIALSLVAVGLFALNIFATLSEIAFSEASLTKLRYSVSSLGGRTAVKLLDDKQRVKTTMRIVNIVSQAAFAVILYVLMVATIEPKWLGILIAALIALVVIVVFGEVIPTALALRTPERVAAILSLPVIIFFYLFYPLTSLAGFITKVLEKTLKFKKRPDMSERDLHAVITDVYDEGTIEKEEHDLIQNSLDFDDQRIDKVMTPMAKVVYADNKMSIGQIKNIFLENNYSRMPYLDKRTGEILGILFQKDFYAMLLTGEKPVSKLIKPALFLPENISASLALKRLQRFRQYTAIVRDTDRKMAVGLLTVEDLVEELVGEIEDEYDAEDIIEQRSSDLKKRSQLAVKAEKHIRGSDFADTEILPRRADDEHEEEAKKPARKQRQPRRPHR